MTIELPPALTTDLLYPPDAAFMARTDLVVTKMLGYTKLQLDTVTTLLPGLLNGLCTVRHEAGAGPEVIGIYRRAGVKIAEDTFTFRTQEEAEVIADRLIAQGKRLFWPYPPTDMRYPEEAHLVSPELSRFLNAKVNMPAFIPPQHLALRRILSFDELKAFKFSGPVFLKAAGDAATGWGFAVRACQDFTAFQNARQWFTEHRDSIPSVIMEEAVELVNCWCAGLAVGAAKTVCFGGAEQLFNSPANQSGSIIDPDAAFPEAARALAVQIGKNAGKLGFKGIAGLDIGLASDGRLIVFDPNFRFNSSTSQLLFHESAAARSGLSVSCSVQLTPTMSFSELAVHLEAPISDGWFVPTRIFNGEKHSLSEGRHIVTGFVLGRDRTDAKKAVALLQTLIV